MKSRFTEGSEGLQLKRETPGVATLHSVKTRYSATLPLDSLRSGLAFGKLKTDCKNLADLLDGAAALVTYALA